MSRFFRDAHYSSPSDADSSDYSTSDYSDSECSDSDEVSIELQSAISNPLSFSKKVQKTPVSQPTKKTTQRRAATSSEDDEDSIHNKSSDSDDSYFDQDSSSSEDESDQEVKGLTGRDKWLKREILEARGLWIKEADEPSKQEVRRKAKQRQQQQQKHISDDEEEEDETAISTQPLPSASRSVQLTDESVFKQLDQVMEARGKKNTDKQAQVDILRALYTKLAITPYQKVRVLLGLLPAQFDLASSYAYMASTVWKDMASDIKDLLEIIEENRLIVITDTVTEVESDSVNEEKIKNGDSVYLLGNISSYIDRLDQEFVKSLLYIDPHTSEYTDRLKTEIDLYTLIVRAQHYFEEIESKDALALIVLCRLEHIYYKTSSMIQSMHDQVKILYPKLAPFVSYQDTVDRLYFLLSKIPHERIRAKALLLHVYHLALHDKYVAARDELHSLDWTELLQSNDFSVQALYYRASAQLGLSAFRAGLFKECESNLHELMISGRVRESLAQGTFFFGNKEKTAEQERLEKSRQLPVHMHINLSTLECVYNTCAMLIEVPALAMHKHEYRRRVVAKPFKRLMDFSERQIFMGPPENIRDNIMIASRKMIDGDWQGAVQVIMALNTWDLMTRPQEIRDMLTAAIKQESLVTFAFSSLSFYKEWSIQSLAEQFELPIKQVTKILSSLIITSHLPAKFEDDYLVVNDHQKTKLHTLMNSYVDKLNVLIENNEKMMDVKNGPEDRRKQHKRPVQPRA